MLLSPYRARVGDRRTVWIAPRCSTDWVAISGVVPQPRPGVGLGGRYRSNIELPRTRRRFDDASGGGIRFLQDHGTEEGSSYSTFWESGPPGAADLFGVTTYCWIEG